MRRETNFFKAINWLRPNLILCNEIASLDESIYDNLDDDAEVYQWFLSSLSEDDVRWMEKSFDMGCVYTYSNMLDLWVVGVTHYGTSWDSVPATCINDDIDGRNL